MHGHQEEKKSEATVHSDIGQPSTLLGMMRARSFDEVAQWFNILEDSQRAACFSENEAALAQLVSHKDASRFLANVNVAACSGLFNFFVKQKSFLLAAKLLVSYSRQEGFVFLLNAITAEKTHSKLLRGVWKKVVGNQEQAQNLNQRVRLINQLFIALSRHQVPLQLDESRFTGEAITKLMMNLPWLEHDVCRNFFKISSCFHRDFSRGLHSALYDGLKDTTNRIFAEIKSCLERRVPIPERCLGELYRQGFDYAAFLNAHVQHVAMSPFDEMFLCMVSDDASVLEEFLEESETSFEALQDEWKMLLDYAAVFERKEVFQALCPTLQVLAHNFVGDRFDWQLTVAYFSRLAPDSERLQLQGLVERVAGENRAAAVEAARVLLPNMTIESESELARLYDLALKGKISPDFRLSGDNTLLHCYAKENDEAKVRQLLLLGADASLVNSDEETAGALASGALQGEFADGALLNEAASNELFSNDHQLDQIRKFAPDSSINYYFCKATSGSQSFSDYLINNITDESFVAIVSALLSDKTFDPYLPAVNLAGLVSSCLTAGSPKYVKALKLLQKGYFFNGSICREVLFKFPEWCRQGLEDPLKVEMAIFLLIHLKLKGNTTVLAEAEKAALADLLTLLGREGVVPLAELPWDETLSGYLNAIAAYMAYFLRDSHPKLQDFISVLNNVEGLSVLQVRERMDAMIDCVATPVIKQYLIMTLLQSPICGYLIDFEPAYLMQLCKAVEDQLGENEVTQEQEEYPNEPRHRRSLFYVEILLAKVTIAHRSQDPLTALKTIYVAKNYALRYLHHSFKVELLANEIALTLDADRRLEASSLCDEFDALPEVERQPWFVFVSICKARLSLKKERYTEVVAMLETIFQSLNEISTSQQLDNYGQALALLKALLPEVTQEQSEDLIRLSLDCTLSVTLPLDWRCQVLQLQAECLKLQINPQAPLEALDAVASALSRSPDGLFHPAYRSALSLKVKRLEVGTTLSDAVQASLGVEDTQRHTVAETARQLLYPTVEVDSEVTEESSKAVALLNDFHHLLCCSMVLPEWVEDPDACYIEHAKLLEAYSELLVKLNLVNRAELVYELESTYALKQGANAVAFRYTDYAEALVGEVDAASWIHQRRCDVYQSASCIIAAMEISQEFKCTFNSEQVISCVGCVGEGWFIQLDYCFMSFFELCLQQIDAALGLSETDQSYVPLNARVMNLSSNIQVVLGNIRDQTLQACKHYYYDNAENCGAHGYALRSISSYAPCEDDELKFHEEFSGYFDPGYIKLSFVASPEEDKTKHKPFKRFFKRIFSDSIEVQKRSGQNTDLVKVISPDFSSVIANTEFNDQQLSFRELIGMYDDVKQAGYSRYHEFVDYLHEQQPFSQNKRHLSNPTDKCCYDWLSAAQDFQNAAKHYHIPTMLMLNILEKRSGLIHQSVMQSYYGYVKKELSFEGLLQFLLSEVSLLDETNLSMLNIVLNGGNCYGADAVKPEMVAKTILDVALKLEGAQGLSPQLFMLTNRIAQLLIRRQLIMRNLIESPTAYLPTSAVIRLNLYHTLELVKHLQASRHSGVPDDSVAINPDNISGSFPADNEDLRVLVGGWSGLDEHIDVDLRSEFQLCVKEYQVCINKMIRFREQLKNQTTLSFLDRQRFNTIQFKSVALAIKLRQLMDKIVVRRGRYFYYGSNNKSNNESVEELKVPYMKTGGRDYALLEELLRGDLMKEAVSNIIDNDNPVAPYGALLREMTNELKHSGPQFVDCDLLAQLLAESNGLPIRVEKYNVVVDLFDVLRWGFESTYQLLCAFSTKAEEVAEATDPDRYQKKSP